MEEQEYRGKAIARNSILSISSEGGSNEVQSLFDYRVMGRDVHSERIVGTILSLIGLTVIFGVSLRIAGEFNESLFVFTLLTVISATIIVFGPAMDLVVWYGKGPARLMSYFIDKDDATTLYGHTTHREVIALKSWQIVAMNNEVRPNMTMFLTYLARTGIPVTYRYSVVPAKGRGAMGNDQFKVSITFTTWARQRYWGCNKRTMRHLNKGLHKNTAVLNALYPTMPHQCVKELNYREMIHNHACPFREEAIQARRMPVISRNQIIHLFLKIPVLSAWTWAILVALASAGVPGTLGVWITIIAFLGIIWFLVPEAAPFLDSQDTYEKLDVQEDLRGKSAWHRGKRKAGIFHNPATNEKFASIALHAIEYPLQPTYRLRMRLGSLERVLQKHLIPHTWQVYFHPSPPDFLVENFNVLNLEGKRRILGGNPETLVDRIGENVKAVGGFHVAMVTLFVYSTMRDGGADPVELRKDVAKKATIAANAMVQTLGLKPTRKVRPRDFVLHWCPVKQVFRCGTRGQYAALFGNELADLITIPDELKKGLDVVIAAEFNTPLNLDNAILLGKTINMEYNSLEVDFGISQAGLGENWIITGGPERERQDMLGLLVEKMVPLNRGGLVLTRDRTQVEHLAETFMGSPHAGHLMFITPGEDFWMHLFFPDQLNPPELGKSEAFLRDVTHATAMSFKLDRKQEAFVYGQFLEVRKNADVEAVLQGFNERLAEIRETHEATSIFNAEGMYLLSQFCAGSWSVAFENRTGLPEFSEIFRDHSDKIVVVDLSCYPPEVAAYMALFLLVKVSWMTENFDLGTTFVTLDNLDHYFLQYQTNLNVFSPADPILSWVTSLGQAGIALYSTVGYFSYLPGLITNEFPNFLCHRVRARQEIQAITNYMNLKDYVGTGHYSTKRKDAYQLKFLQVLNPGQAIVKRSDFQEPFPVQLEHNKKCKTDSNGRNTFMEHVHGWKKSDLTSQTTIAPTMLEQDLSHHSIYADAVVEFAEILAQDPRGVKGFSKTNLLQVLSTQVRPYAQKHGIDPQKDAGKLRRYLEEILQILIEKKYVVARYTELGGEEPISPRYEISEKMLQKISQFRAVHIPGCPVGDESEQMNLEDTENFQEMEEGDLEVLEDPEDPLEERNSVEEVMIPVAVLENIRTEAIDTTWKPLAAEITLERGEQDEIDQDIPIEAIIRDNVARIQEELDCIPRQGVRSRDPPAFSFDEEFF